MDEESLIQAVIAERPRLLGLAYRMIGSRSEAEDVVQEAILRAHRAGAEVDSPAAYLTTITTRLAIDHLRSARVRRESYVGPWLPEPIAADPAPDAAARAVLEDTLSIAFLVALETLSPDERAVLVLHDVFAFSHAEIAAMLQRRDASCRQLLRRARQRLESGNRRSAVDRAQRDEIVRRFVAACEGGDLDSFLAALTDDVELVFDGGPEVKTAARRPIRGADRVARFLAFAMSRIPDRMVEPTTLNGGPAVVLQATPGRSIGAVFIEASAEGAVITIRWVRNPAKLAGLH